MNTAVRTVRSRAADDLQSFDFVE